MFVLKKKLIHDYQLMLLGLNGECLLLRNCAIIVQWSGKDKGTQEEY